MDTTSFSSTAPTACVGFKARALGPPQLVRSSRTVCLNVTTHTYMLLMSIQAFNLRLAPMGRLTMLRHVILKLESESSINRRSVGQRVSPAHRDRVWREWATYVFQEREGYSRHDGKDDIGLPSLEKLTLDFTEWQLANHEGLFVSLSVQVSSHSKFIYR